MIPVSVGDFVVIEDSWGSVEAVKVERVSPHRLRVHNGHRALLVLRSRAVFAGAEDAARRIVNRIVSSRALSEQEQQNARIRHGERRAKIIAGAQA